MMQLTLGFSSCPNDTYIFEGWVHQRVQGSFPVTTEIQDVEQLNQGAKSSRLDVTKASIHAFFHLAKDYQLLDAGAALGRGCGPLWIGQSSEAPKGGKVALPGEWTTANLLFQLAVDGDFQPCFMPFDQVMSAVLSGEVDSGVIIHESRFTYRKFGFSSYLDLGQWWETRSGQAIPLGGILVRRSLDRQTKKEIEQLICRSIEYAENHPKVARAYIREWAQELEDSVIDQHIQLYVNQYSKSLQETGRQAILRLYHEALDKGVIAPGEPEHFFV